VTQAEKLFKKLMNGSISGPELESLLMKSGWRLLRATGSHMIWGCEEKRLTLVANRKKLLPYQLKEARKALGYED
jgi:predicted RNA binding protein YcfA (HicA-like mRNA interferase family)